MGLPCMGPRRLWLGDVWVVCLHQVRALVYSRVCWSLSIGHLVGSRGHAGGSRRGTSHLVAARVSAPRGVASGSVDARMVAVRWDARLLSVAAAACVHRGAGGVCSRRLRQQRWRTRRGRLVVHRLIPGCRG